MKGSRRAYLNANIVAPAQKLNSKGGILIEDQQRERKQRRLIVVGERNLDDLVAFPANGESELAVAGPMAAGDEGRFRLQPVHHAHLH